MQNYLIKPGGNLNGEIIVPGDKSISHRALILGAIAAGVTRVTNFLQSEDCLATLRALRALGVSIVLSPDGSVAIEGVGLNGLQAPEGIINAGNSGTSIRLLTGLLAAQPFSSVLTGDASLCKRPMARIVDPLRRMGALIDMRADNFPPLTIHGGQRLQAIDYPMPTPSAQVKSGLLLAGLYAQGNMRITESALTRDHTERLLAAFGVKILKEGQTLTLQKSSRLHATDINVPADISSAAFFIVGAAIAENSEILLKNVGVNPTRTGIITILQKMGAQIQLINQRLAGTEPVADILVKSSQLQGIEIPVELVPLAIDEFPAIFIASACAQGTTLLRGAAELRVKESDRLQVMAKGLQAVGIEAQTTQDGIIIHGGQIQGGVIHSHGDHRIAMAFALAGLAAKAEIIVEDCVNVATSFPDFAKIARQAGLNIKNSAAERPSLDY